MSLHIIKCKTILKINEIETINLTQYLNFHRHTETGGKSMCALGLFRGPCRYSAVTALIFRGIQPGSKWRSSGHILSGEMGIWLAHSQNPLGGSGAQAGPRARPEVTSLPWRVCQKGNVSTLTSPASRRFSWLLSSVSPIVHLHQGGLAAAWLHLFKRFNTTLSRLVGPKLEWYFFFFLQALQLLLHVGVDSMSKQMFSLCFFL